MQIEVTEDDILVRPWFNSLGDFLGYFANVATDIGPEPFGSGDLLPTPQAALDKFLEDQWPEIAATAFSRRWIANRPNYDG